MSLTEEKRQEILKRLRKDQTPGDNTEVKDICKVEIVTPPKGAINGSSSTE